MLSRSSKPGRQKRPSDPVVDDAAAKSAGKSRLACDSGYRVERAEKVSAVRRLTGENCARVGRNVAFRSDEES